MRYEGARVAGNKRNSDCSFPGYPSFFKCCRFWVARGKQPLFERAAWKADNLEVLEEGHFVESP